MLFGAKNLPLLCIDLRVAMMEKIEGGDARKSSAPRLQVWEEIAGGAEREG